MWIFLKNNIGFKNEIRYRYKSAYKTYHTNQRVDWQFDHLRYSCDCNVQIKTSFLVSLNTYTNTCNHIEMHVLTFLYVSALLESC